MKTYFLLIMAVALLTGCAALSTKKSALGADKYSFENAGLVIGYVESQAPFGTFIGFTNLSTGERFEHPGAREIFIWLPEGEYEISEIGSRRGVMGAYDPSFKFAVSRGKVNYIGHLAYGCNYTSIDRTWYGFKDCGLLALGKCSVPSQDIPMCLVNKSSQYYQEFRKAHADYENSKIIDVSPKM